MEHLISCTCILFLLDIIEIGLLGTPEFLSNATEVLRYVIRIAYIN